jgi:glycosyltransferase involved in cell wall biosynthesis
MAREILVSTIIPTYNRRDLVQRAIESVLAQDVGVEEVIVVDDGSTDGTAEALRARYGERITCLRQANAGVSAARNAGMAAARGQFLALLDSDDLWTPDKTRRQLALFEADPSLGMVLCDVDRVNADGAYYDTFHRREVIAQDGWAFAPLLRNPSLVPASAMLRREVFETVGGFDTTLRTAEDIDFHLRVARRWRIGVVEASLVKAMRGHDGLSAESSTYDDYVRVVERAVAEARTTGDVDDRLLREALAITYTRNARGMVLRSRWKDAWRLARQAWGAAPTGAERRAVLALAPFAARRWLATLRD